MPVGFAVRELTKEEMPLQWPLIKQLAPPEETQSNYERMLKEMLGNGYRMVAVFDGATSVGVSGFWVGTKLYSGKYMEPDNVIVDHAYRSKGVGKLLLDWLTADAKRIGCKMLMLDAYVENFPGHKFYYREGFIARGYHFLKKL